MRWPLCFLFMCRLRLESAVKGSSHSEHTMEEEEESSTSSASSGSSTSTSSSTSSAFAFLVFLVAFNCAFLGLSPTRKQPHWRYHSYLYYSYFYMILFLFYIFLQSYDWPWRKRRQILWPEQSKNYIFSIIFEDLNYFRVPMHLSDVPIRYNKESSPCFE